jgi:hypothetical protein
MQQGLLINCELGHDPEVASAHSQISKVYLLLCELGKAEEHGLRAVEIDESLGVVEVYIDYANMARVAQARGRDEEADRWIRKHDNAILEIACRSWGLAPGNERRFVETFLALAADCAHTGIEETELSDATRSALARISKLPMPLSPLGGFLWSLQRGDPSPVPTGLPTEIWECLHKLRREVLDSKQEVMVHGGDDRLHGEV